MGEPIFISFFPLSNKMHSYYLNDSKSLDQEMGHEPLFRFESNLAPSQVCVRSQVIVTGVL